jgi:hypothetical protein
MMSLYRPHRLQWELNRRGLDWADLVKAPLSLGSSTATALRHGRRDPSADTLRRLGDFLKAHPVVVEIDALLDPPDEGAA